MAHPRKVERYRRAREFAQVVNGLWHSWDDDAFLRDRASGVFFDRSKMHVLNHDGKYFRVRGPLNVARSPQGQPVLVQAGASEGGMELAAETAEVVFAAQSGPCRKSDPDILMVKPAQHWLCGDASDRLDGTCDRCILA